MQETNELRTDSPLALVIGATGKTGRRVVDRLEKLGVPTRAVSRSTTPRFDWDDRSTWADALEGVTRAYVTYAPDLAVPEAPEAIRAFAALAEAQGVERLVLLSGRGEEAAQRCEQIVLATNPKWTVVRANWFNQNFSEGFFLAPIQHGHLALPAGPIGDPFVDADDIADVAVAALTEAGHQGEIYEVTGPRVVTFAEAVAEIAKATGRTITYEQVPVDAFVEGMRAQQVPEVIVGLTRYLFETVMDGRNASVADGVQRALGRPPRDFRAYAESMAATGLWNGEVASGDAEHARVMRRFVDEVINGGDLGVIDEVVHPEYVHRSPGEEIRGRDGLLALLGAYRGAFPNLAMEVDDLVVSNDTTVLSFTLSGTHRGELLGNRPTGRPMKVHGMVRSRFRDGLIAEEWEILDQLAMFEQLGIAATAS